MKFLTGGDPVTVSPRARHLLTFSSYTRREFQGEVIPFH
ncbi:hypothetical protein KKC1_05790 [Calderihabitans maritimus]|uniref:Uncharacterized protein n=1 Tax=Calderihabitans maritimus TaxID=1246530 RepID=A0A1Z5HPX4_9FIRM|nr:hypothetical protein KKC1_05790 [Calderihabitans maritimus]